MGAGGDFGGGMAHLQRLIWFVIGVLISAFPMLAFAATGTKIVGADQYNAHMVGRMWADQSPSYALATSIKDAVRFPETASAGGTTGGTPCGAVRHTGNGNPFNGWAFEQSYCHPSYQGGTVGFVTKIAYLYYNYPVTTDCQEGRPLDPVTGQCFTCPPDRIWNGTTCESPCQAKAGNSYGTANSWAMLDVDSVPSGSGTFCDGTCSVSGGKVECESTSAGGTSGDFVSLGSTCTVQGPFTYTGQGCGPAGSAPQLVGVDDVEKPWWDKGLDAKDCSAQGGFWGNVNGIDACVRPQPGDSFYKETSTGNETGKETETAADGTTTEKETTTSTECKDGKCTTTTTTTTTNRGADGQQIGSPTTESRTETKQEADFCKLNPQHAQCSGTETGGSFAGSCASGFTCSGDAVQCAIARAQHESTCALAVGDGVLGEFSAIQGFDGTAPGEGLDRKQIDVPTSLDVAEIGGGAGLTDMTITVMGQSIEIPLSELNRFIAMFGYAIMAIAWVGAWRIISGAF